ncbi:hypothetical protein BCT30_18905 [Enterovibrio norvegicus]|uniref:Uncharacterized protein n=2 Tax=Enterovibrio norvegicus TaxID=188144 RepID=A0A1I5LUE1_9GAMM|nr:hypothetical protein [Enterovibrio norvegicus]MCC4798493.1 hypothetical protein [Enterovibrio norvegicus]OEE43657.1 hypothetical protein A1OS_10200 [Enterovibrio norvegicus]OEF48909.1 hypothetical protein A1OW_13615 [Enterovibrio norvegicus]OEF57109.1 hypothetical protein A1OU_20410 [Enterovibrio norvegicus]PMH65488.1 hypothetical protein BCU62_12910 [Enterovibrio norvegicus]
MHSWKEQYLTNFDVEVISKRSIGNPGTDYQASGHGDAWHYCLTVELEGFNDIRKLRLDDIWKDMIEHKKTQFSGVVLALETLVKFGDQVTLETPYDVVINVEY